jgi:hypothetical protein
MEPASGAKARICSLLQTEVITETLGRSRELTWIP